MTELRSVPMPNSCLNCDHRRWGEFEGWDHCEKTGLTLDWAKRQLLICDQHKVTTAKDPRNVGRDLSVDVLLKNSQIRQLLDLLPSGPSELRSRLEVALEESRP